MKRLTKEIFINKAIYVHGNEYDYSLVEYVNDKSKVIILCSKHGEFLQIPKNHLNGSRCPLCRNEYLSKKFAMNGTEFKKKAHKIHGNLYDYSKVNYINANTKIKIICRIHGEFSQIPGNHLSGSGCYKCAKIKSRKKCMLSINSFIEKSNQIHGNLYNYDDVNYINHMTKVNIICSKHGMFKQTPNSHLSGSGCPSCRESQGEKKISNFLKKHNIQFKKQVSFDGLIGDFAPLSYDFYLPKHKMMIEYDGIQHVKPVEFFGGLVQLKKQRIYDMKKIRFAMDNGYRLLKLQYGTFKYLEEALWCELKNQLVL